MVGPWGWAARMQREELLVATAVLMGFDFDPDRRPYTLLGGPYQGLPIPAYVPDWLYAELWLKLAKNVAITNTLETEKLFGGEGK